MKNVTPSRALALAVEKAGGQSAFGRLIGRRQSTVRDWLVAGKGCPAEHVLTVETELQISRHTLRPDIYPVVHERLPAVAKPLETIGIPVACNREPILQAAQ